LPNERLLTLTLSVGTAAFNCSAKVFDTLPAVEVNVVAWAVPTDDIVAVNPAVVAPAGTVSVAGTATATLLLATLMTKPPLGARALSVAVHTSVPDPVNEEFVQEREASVAGTGVPVPLSPITVDEAVEELLSIVSCPEAAPVAAGSNCTLSVIACPGFKVAGNVAPETVKPVPLSDALLIVTGPVPVELRVTACAVATVFTWTLPKARLFALTLSVGTAAFNCRAKLFDVLDALAVSVATCAVATDETTAVNPPLVAPAGTDTVAGTTTAVLLLIRLTTMPSLGAAAASVTVQASELEPVIAEAAHDNPVNAVGTGLPVPLRPITVAATLEELLFNVTWPEAAPRFTGVNCTLSVKVCPGFIVAGKEDPDSVNPEPVSAALLTVTGAVPLEVNVTNCGVAAVFSCTLPNVRLFVLTVSVGTAALNCRENGIDAAPALAVRVAV